MGSWIDIIQVLDIAKFHFRLGYKEIASYAFCNF